MKAKPKRSAIKEVANTAYQVGTLPQILVPISALMVPFARHHIWTDWLDAQLQAIAGIHVTAFWLGIGSSLTVAIPGLIGMELARRNIVESQTLRDQKLGTGSFRALFLRSFLADKSILVSNPYWSVWQGHIAIERAHLNIEEFVGRVLELHADVIEIGGDPKSIGPTRLRLPDEIWRKSFLELLLTADFVVALPLVGTPDDFGYAQGMETIWELSEVAAHRRITRLIIIMPPSSRREREKICAAWDRACTSALRFGLKLPGYKSQGGIYLSADLTGTAFFELTGGYGNRKRLAGGLIQAIEVVKRRLAMNREAHSAA